MMKKLVLISLICVVSAVTMPVSADLISDADLAYVSDQFERAVELYDRAVDSLGGSSERYYNLGNAYFRSGHPGMAIVSYERALRLDPTDSDVRDNLEFVNSRITDRIDAGDSFINNSVDSIAVSLHPDTWGVIALVTFLLMLAGVLVYFMASGIMLRKVGFFGAGGFLPAVFLPGSLTEICGRLPGGICMEVILQSIAGGNGTGGKFIGYGLLWCLIFGVAGQLVFCRKQRKYR